MVCGITDSIDLGSGVAKASRLGARNQRGKHSLEAGAPTRTSELRKLQASKARRYDCRRQEGIPLLLEVAYGDRRKFPRGV